MTDCDEDGAGSWARLQEEGAVKGLGTINLWLWPKVAAWAREIERV